jgi:hypothetical protein
MYIGLGMDGCDPTRSRMEMRLGYSGDFTLFHHISWDIYIFVVTCCKPIRLNMYSFQESLKYGWVTLPGMMTAIPSSGASVFDVLVKRVIALEHNCSG